MHCLMVSFRTYNHIYIINYQLMEGGSLWPKGCRKLEEVVEPNNCLTAIEGFQGGEIQKVI